MWLWWKMSIRKYLRKLKITRLWKHAKIILGSPISVRFFNPLVASVAAILISFASFLILFWTCPKIFFVWFDKSDIGSFERDSLLPLRVGMLKGTLTAEAENIKIKIRSVMRTLPFCKLTKIILSCSEGKSCMDYGATENPVWARTVKFWNSSLPDRGKAWRRVVSESNWSKTIGTSHMETSPYLEDF